MSHYCFNTCSSSAWTPVYWPIRAMCCRWTRWYRLATARPLWYQRWTVSSSSWRTQSAVSQACRSPASIRPLSLSHCLSTSTTTCLLSYSRAATSTLRSTQAAASPASRSPSPILTSYRSVAASHIIARWTRLPVLHVLRCHFCRYRLTPSYFKAAALIRDRWSLSR